MQRNPWARQGLLLFVALAIVLVLVLVRRHYSRPIQGASAVPGTHGRVARDLTRSGYNYFEYFAPSHFWLSPESLICIQERRRGSYETLRWDVSEGLGHRSEGRALAGMSSGAWDPAFYWRVSPDGLRMLWVEADAEDVIYHIADFAATRRSVWTNRYQGGVFASWLSDSSAVVDWPTRDGGFWMRIYNSESGAFTELSLDELNLIEAGPDTPGLELGFRSPHVVRGGRSLLADQCVEVLVAPPASEGESWTRYRVVLPAEILALGSLHHVEAVLCPEGRRWLWAVTVQRGVDGYTFRGAFPFLERVPRFGTRLYTSDWKGEECRLIGVAPQVLRGLAWHPEARQISFVADQTLWLLPVD